MGFREFTGALDEQPENPFRVEPAVQLERDRGALQLKLDELIANPDDEALRKDFDNTLRSVARSPRATPAKRLVEFTGVLDNEAKPAKRFVDFTGALDNEPVDHEVAAASQPARMITTRGGQPLIVKETKPDAFDLQGEPRAPWTGEGGVLPSLPAQLVGGARQAAGQLQAMAGREAATQLIAPPVSAEQPPETPARMTLTRGGQPVLGAPPQTERLAEAGRSIAAGTALAGQAERDLALVTPWNMNTAQQAVSSVAQSAPSTLAGVAVGILTKNPGLAMLIAGGGGSALQGANTYGEAFEKTGSHRGASVSATIDAVLEGVGEALPLKIALAPGSPVLARLWQTIAAEAGQEAATQAMQDFHAFLTYDPNITLQQAWQNIKVAALAGAAMGGPIAAVGAAANAKWKPLFPPGQSGTPTGETQNAAPPDVTPLVPTPTTVPQAGASAETPGPVAPSRAELENILADERPLPEIQKEAESRADSAAEVAPTIPEVNGDGTRAAPITVEHPEGALAAKARSDAEWRGRLSQMTFDELAVAYQAARTHNDAVELEAIRKFLGEDKAAQFGALKTRRAKNRWLDDNIIDEAQDFMNRRQHPESLIEEYRHAANDFDIDSPQALGRSIAVRSRKVDDPGFMTSPDGLAFKNALTFAKEQGWDLESVLAGMRQRSAEWAGADAPELFSRLFKEATQHKPALPKTEGLWDGRDNHTTDSGNQSHFAVSPPSNSGAEVTSARGQNKADSVASDDESVKDKPPTDGDLAASAVVMSPAYTAAGGTVNDQKRARPDAIRQAIRDLFNVPINEKLHHKSRDTLGIYRIKPRTIRVRNQNDIAVIAHELGHHFSETSQEIRKARKAFDGELKTITPYAASQRTAALQREEGMAEFVRLYLTESAQAQAKAPGFFKAFEAYVAKDKRAQGAFTLVKTAIADWQALPPAERILAKVGTFDPSIAERLKNAIDLDKFIFHVLDKWLPLRRMVEDLAPNIAASKDPFKLAHLLSGDAAIVEDWLMHETVPFDFARRADPQDRGKPLTEILKPVAKQLDEFSAYLIAKRASDLLSKGKENLYTKEEIAEGLKLETPEFVAAAKEIYAFNDRLLEYAVEGGLLSEESAAKFRETNPFYVPFFREANSLSGDGGRGGVFKRLTGGTQNLRDPISNIIENAAGILYATNRNYVLASARQLARSVPGGGRWMESVPVPVKPTTLSTQKIIDELRSQGVTIDPSTASALDHMQTFFVKHPADNERERTIIIKVGGEPTAVQINDPMLHQALMHFQPAYLGIVVDLLAVPARLLRAGVTLSVEFMARNFLRDTIAGFLQSKAGILPLIGTAQGFKEVATRSDTARLFRAFGGSYADMWKGDSDKTRKTVVRMARRGGFKPWTILTPRGTLDLLERLGSLSEAGTRVGEFKKTVEKADPTDDAADTMIEAAFRAREVSVDFGQHGASDAVRILTRITPFLNPAMQGFYKMARTGREQFLLTLLRGSLLTAASVALYLLNSGKDWYDDLEEWEKNTYWHFDVGLRSERGAVVPVRLPKPFEWGAMFGSVPEALTGAALGKDDDSLGKRLWNILAQAFALRMIPTGALVPMELWANKSTFTDRPIVPESRVRLPAALQSNPQTSLTAQEVGRLTDTSPAKIDHAVRGTLGTLGVYATMLADQVVRATGDHPLPPEMTWRRMPVVKAFVHDPDNPNSRYITQFYELLTEARQAKGAIKEYQEAGRLDLAAEYEAKPIAGQAKGLEHVSRLMAKINRAMEEARKSRELSPDEKQQRLAELSEEKKQLAREAVRESKK